MAGGSIGLWLSIGVVAGVVLTGYLVYFLPPFGDIAQGCAPAGSSAGPPGCYFVVFFKVIMFLSILCAAFLIFTFAVFGENGKIRTYPIKLIMFLCLSLIVAFTSFIINDQPPIVRSVGGCFFIGLISHYAFLANFCWTFCIAFNFYRMIVAQDRDTRSYEKWYHIACWGIPAVIVFILAMCSLTGTNQYGQIPGTYNCFIPNQTARLVAFFVPGLLVVSSNTVLFIFVAREIRETLKGASEIRGVGDKKDIKRQLRVYVSIVFSIGLAWFFGFISSLLSLIDSTKIPAQIFDVLFNVFVPLQGFFLFGSYCVNEKIFKKYAEAFGKVFPCCNVIVEKLDFLATASTTGTSGSKTGSQSKTGSSAKSTSSTSSQKSDVEMSQTDSRY